MTITTDTEVPTDTALQGDAAGGPSDVARAAAAGIAGRSAAVRSAGRPPARPVPARPVPARQVPARPARVVPPPVSRAALGLLRQAAAGLVEAHREQDPLLRYPAAYLAALRAGAAVLAVRAVPSPRRGTPRNVWQLLADVAPELAEWAAFFAACSDTRAAAEAGIARLVTARDADDLLRQAEQFVRLVGESLPLR